MATVSLLHIEDELDGLSNTKTMEMTRDGVDDLDQFLVFLGDAIRASGYTYVDRLGWADELGAIKWAPF